MATTATARLAEARSQLGTKENPWGSNKQKYGVWYGWNGVPWCDIGISWLFRDNLDLIHGKNAYTPTHARRFDQADEFTKGTAGIRPGDIVFFAFYGSDYQGRWLGIHHVGICEAVRSNGDLVCIEWNTGNMVKRMVRSPRGVAGYGRPKYAKEKPVSKPNAGLFWTTIPDADRAYMEQWFKGHGITAYKHPDDTGRTLVFAHCGDVSLHSIAWFRDVCQSRGYPPPQAFMDGDGMRPGQPTHIQTMNPQNDKILP